MPQSLAQVYVHLTYSTAGRRNWLDKALRPDLFAYKAAILRELDSPAVIIGGVDDHVHLLFSLSRNHAIKAVVQNVKGSSSMWMKERGRDYAAFQWQAGYAIFSVSASNSDKVRRYIENQETRHRKQSFQDELLALLEKHSMEYDPQHLWD